MKEPYLEKLLRRLRLYRVQSWIPLQSTVLDIGCGWQALALRELAPHISFGSGLDFKVEAQNLPAHIETHQFRIEKRPWPVKKIKYDCILMLAVLEHIAHSNLDDLFAGIRENLKPGGRLILTTPTPPSKPILEFLSYRLGLINPDEIRDHKIYYNKKMIEELFRKNGLRIKHYSRFQLGLNSFCVGEIVEAT